MSNTVDAVRTDTKVATKAPITVTIGGREFKITPQTRRISRLWKSKVFDIIGEQGDIQDVLVSMTSALGKDTTFSGGAVGELAKWLVWFASSGGEEILDTVYDYDPTAFTDDDRAHCDEHGYTDEFVSALVCIVRLVYSPFGALAGAFGMTAKKVSDVPA